MADSSEGRIITGRTRVLGILAHPTEHVKAPPAINRIAAERGRDAVMVPFDVAPADLAAVVTALRLVKSLDGSIVTVPHKQSIMEFCDEVTPQAAAVGAVNILRFEPDGRLIGGQLDGIGFVAGLRAAAVDPWGRRVLLAGAGGAASAVAFALAEAGVSHITLSNRSRPKIEDLRDRLQAFRPGLSVSLGSGDAGGHDLVVNATTLGMKAGDPLPIDPSTLRADMVVAEVIMEPEMTPLLIAAQEAGCRVHLGRHMLDHQLQLMADFMGL
ncbi:shikimate dehydrogenase family protein [Azospirillum brasilense]|uniref:shikimate dehydrogenase family protein n=1 Tax=Azospirillum brasilense TaxID=192 RepID=UPI000E68B791|nr:shikimate dehydrogenase [Azospirillum brasilense]NUB23598.1 shikimate dehydrogenase [Azospirillum brasilense]NUB30753.1 shikimate dehydrogenase [Azospirillum brasilense]RIW05195.1 shikimate dehydrogenase [Azospirillum brasilense]